MRGLYTAKDNINILNIKGTFVMGRVIVGICLIADSNSSYSV